jgi:hypothetical protein
MSPVYIVSPLAVQRVFLVVMTMSFWSPPSNLRPPIPVSIPSWSPSHFPCPTQHDMTIVLASSPYTIPFFSPRPIGLHQSLCLNTARMTLSITEWLMLCWTLRTLSTMLPDSSNTYRLLIWCSTFQYLCFDSSAFPCVYVIPQVVSYPHSL